MRQIWITEAGAPEVLAVKQEPDPVAGPGEVRVRVRAVGVNFADLMSRLGLYPDAPPLPCVVGYEVAGVVDQVGEGVTRAEVGGRVIAMPKFGGYTDTLVVKEALVFRMPAVMPFEEGAAMPVTYLTAFNMMMHMGYLRPKSTVLIHSAAGGVGIAAVQLAKLRDCTVIGLASKSKHGFLRSIGVHYPLENVDDYAPLVRAIVGEKGVDLILDPVGGKSWSDGYDLLGPCGRLCAYGISSTAAGKTRNIMHAARQLAAIPKYTPRTLMEDNKTISGCNMAHLYSRLDILSPQFDELLAMYVRGEVRPHVDKKFSFDEAAAAHHYIHDRKAVGKVVLVP